jgi:hypothetical protein
MATGFDYAYGDRVLVRVPLAAGTSDIEVGTAITAEVSGGSATGFFEDVDASGETTVGIAVEKVSSPSTDGAASVLVDISANSYYRVNPDTGTAAETLRFKTCDIGADGRSANIDASATDNVKIHEVRTSDNALLVSIIPAAYVGVA